MSQACVPTGPQPCVHSVPTEGKGSCGKCPSQDNEHREGVLKFWHQVQPRVQISYRFVFPNLYLYTNLYYRSQLQMLSNTKTNVCIE